MTKDNHASDTWLDQIRRLYEEDKLRLQAEQAHEQPAPAQPDTAANLLGQTKAHLLLRQVQKALLNGGGLLEVLDQPEDYDRAIVLMWQGPISAARKPDQAGEDYNYVLVGVRQTKVWVNGKAIREPTPEALRLSLLAACKKPRRSRAG
jgi:hypothetical protein